jgi:exoribonuclease R
MYETVIEPLYGIKRDLVLDEVLLSTNTLPHMYCMNDRIDMTMYETYSIDPDGCQDADDAFSIYTEDSKLYAAIHIADPTEYININSDLWKDIEKRIVTRYPYNKPPIHMMPHQIMEKSSLIVNQYGCIKLAITIVTEIHQSTYEPIGVIQLLFTKICVKKENALSYKRAGELIGINNTISTCLKISNSLLARRSEKTKGTVLNEVSYSFPKYNRNTQTLYLYTDTNPEIQMKQMIAEFAIFANSFIGYYLNINFEGFGIYRICSAREWLNTIHAEISGKELLNEIIVNGIKAEYISTVESHDLVGAAEYTHFTSPIRRMSDCICHYLLKYIHLKKINPGLQVPFSNEKLKIYSNDCMRINKLMKNIQYKDHKFRLIQTMYNMLEINDSITICYYISSYTGLFLNIIIHKINEHSVYISYTLRIPVLVNFTQKEDRYLTITHVNHTTEYDEGSIPELDALFIPMCHN